MDGENSELTGTASEFLEMTGKITASEPDPSPDIPEPDETPTAAADSDSADEEEYNLSPEERVAAVLGEDLDEDETTELVAEDEDEDAPDADPLDLDNLTPEQLRELAAEELRRRAEAPQAELAEIQREAGEAVASAQQEMRQRIKIAFDQEVILSVSEPHYGALIAKAVEENDATAVQRIVRAKATWEAEQREAWAPEANTLIEQAGKQALKQHPGIRRLYAQELAETRKLPKSDIDKILEELDTDRMHEAANHLKEVNDARLAGIRRGNQRAREEAAKRVSANRISSPATGRPKPAKIVPLRGDIDEWMEAKKRGAVG